MNVNVENNVKVDVSSWATTTSMLQLSYLFFFSTAPFSLHYELRPVGGGQNLGKDSNFEWELGFPKPE
jgi:hypothetical protein